VSYYLKGYRQYFWKLIDNLDAFNINYIPHLKNVVVDTLDHIASISSPLNDGFSIELVFQTLSTKKCHQLEGIQ
jgi:hypothetical protein